MVKGLIGIWFAGIFAMAWKGVFDVEGLPLPILLAVAIPIATFLLWTGLSKSFREWISALDVRPLVLLHAFRMLGFAFIILYYYKIIPGSFALKAGLGDMVAAVWAWSLGTRLFQNRVHGTKELWAWNVFGVLDFAVALFFGIAGRTPIDGSTITTGDMGLFPQTLIPTFLVPFFVITHLVIFFHLFKSDKR